MKGWKTNDYFSPKSWARIQEEKRDEELAKVSASPVPMLLWIGFLALCVVAGIVYVILSFAR
ncbi:hypothetical protein KX724_09465 [Stenotrophomonas indicatrix]|jgi:cobalamin biosynthesis Mg chelatase CobN|uniref:hypothetical protein n=1 Tax=Stenotrophomonas indicatrix TaxID=2045451 RepID=UPI001C501856|nr:hypothetical protein [Stenotrophomonas indicatrix]QXQ04288.1 hypothetical protein KX724_09465 [Stenotrophomonas indicatrix]